MAASRCAIRSLQLSLRNSILPKLKKEVTTTIGAPSNTKKSTLDTHRGETYQFCYFFRKTEPHSVVVKSRTFVAIPPQKQIPMPPPPPPAPSSSKSQRGKRKSKLVAEKGFNEGTRKKCKTKGKGRALDENDEFFTSGSENYDEDCNPVEPRQSQRATSSNHIEDVDMVDQNYRNDTPIVSTIDFETDQEEEKPKPVLQLRYQGFDIFGHCLCVVVEPWPPVRSMSRAPSVTTALNGESNLAHPQRVNQDRTRTPLFLPDDYRERSQTPTFSRHRSMPPPPMGSLLDPRFLEDTDDSDEDGGMVLFSQVLNNAGNVRAGAADDDEDMDTDMFFGDADERREL